MVQVMLEVNSESLCCVVHACLLILGHQQYHPKSSESDWLCAKAALNVKLPCSAL